LVTPKCPIFPRKQLEGYIRKFIWGGCGGGGGIHVMQTTRGHQLTSARGTSRKSCKETKVCGQSGKAPGPKWGGRVLFGLSRRSQWQNKSHEEDPRGEGGKALSVVTFRGESKRKRGREREEKSEKGLGTDLHKRKNWERKSCSIYRENQSNGINLG